MNNLLIKQLKKFKKEWEWDVCRTYKESVLNQDYALQNICLNHMKNFKIRWWYYDYTMKVQLYKPF